MGIIYKISNNFDAKVYIGKTTSTLEERWKQHLEKAKLFPNVPFKSKLYAAMKKYGADNFFISVIEQCSNEDLNVRERFWIAKENSYYNGYNLTFGGDGYQTSNLEEIQELWNQGKSIQDIEKTLGLSQTTISKRLNQLSISNQERRSRAHNGVKIVALDKTSLMPICYFNSYAEAARAVGLSCSKSILNVIDNKNRSAGGYRWRKYQECDKELSHGFKI